jgi:hypothetical protein
MDDDEAPPELVDVTTVPDIEQTKLQEEAGVGRVPITIVTGRKALSS